MTQTLASRLTSVVVPAYDTPDPRLLVERLQHALASIPHEIILVDDASRDPTTWPELCALALKHADVKALRLPRNRGQHAATICGLAHASGALVITMDDDLQHDPGAIPSMLAAADHDVVVAGFAEQRHSTARRAGGAAKSLLDLIFLGKPRSLRFSSFRVMKRSVVDRIVAMRAERPFLPALILRATRDIVTVPVPHAPREKGRSGYTPAKLLRVIGDLVANNRWRPIRPSADSWWLAVELAPASARQNASTASITIDCSSSESDANSGSRTTRALADSVTGH